VSFHMQERANQIILYNSNKTHRRSELNAGRDKRYRQFNRKK
jgi:hypothetical protein